MYSRNNKSMSSFGRTKKEQVIDYCVRSTPQHDVNNDKAFGRPKKEQVIDYHVRPSDQYDGCDYDDDHYDNCLGNNVFGNDL